MASRLKRRRASGTGTEIWHLNCGTMGSRAGDVLAKTPVLEGSTYVCHCLLLETGERLVLVDTGFGMTDCTEKELLGLPFRTMVGPVLDPDETAFRRIWALDLDPRDVSDIVMTHLDRDHAGGLPDFPWAKVHVTADELAAATKPKLSDRARYLKRHWKHDPDWVGHEPGAEDWFGFEAVRPIPDLDTELLLVSLPGHSVGHAGVAIKMPDGRWLLHAADSFFFHAEIDDPPHCPPGLTGFQRISADDWGERNDTLGRLRELARDHGGEVAMVCSHDPLMMVGV